MAVVNERLMQIKRDNRYTSIQMAEHLGVTPLTMGKYLKDRDPSLATLIKACDIYNVSLPWLVGLTDQKQDILQSISIEELGLSNSRLKYIQEMKSYGEDIQSSIIRMLKAHQNLSGDMIDLESYLTFLSSMAAYMRLIAEQLEQKAGIEGLTGTGEAEANDPDQAAGGHTARRLLAASALMEKRLASCCADLTSYMADALNVSEDSERLREELIGSRRER